MGRPVKENKVPMTTISLEEPFVKAARRYKEHNESWTSFLRRILVDWQNTTALRKENEFLVEAMEKQSKVIEKHIQLYPELARKESWKSI